MLHNGYAVQELHGSDADLNEVRGSRPVADNSTQLTAPLCQTHPPAVPQVCLFVLSALVNHTVSHGVFWHAQWLMCKFHSKHCRFNVAFTLVTTNDSIHDTASQHGNEGDFKSSALGIIYTQGMCSLSVVTPLLRQHLCCSVLICGE